jgi:hypothetical protein
MTIEEKIVEMGVGIAPDVADTDVLESELLAAESLILNKMYPFGYEDGTEIPARYERLQIKLAVELYSKRGAEGQVSHGENGVTRNWATESSILKQVVPMCASVQKGR